MQNPLKYSLDEIARMRAAVSYLTGSEGAEDRLRTYMMNGTDADELVKAAEAERTIRESVQLSRQRDMQWWSDKQQTTSFVSGLYPV